MHYVNTGTTPILVRDVVRLKKMDPAQVTTWVSPFAFNHEGFNVPPHGEQTVTFDCTMTKPYKLLLVGGGPQEAALRAQAERLGLADAVTFSGRVPHADVNAYYDLIDVLCYPRHPMRLTELVTPLKPLEAMAQGRLFVASDVGGHRELIRDGETGVLFRAGSAGDLAALRARSRASESDALCDPTGLGAFRVLEWRLP